MDPLSITAACVSLTATIAKTTHSITLFVRAVRAARSDLDAVARELASLTTLLGILGEDAEDVQNFPETLRGNIISILSNCELVLVEVTRVISKYDKPGVVSGSKWVLAGSDDVSKLRLSLEAHKTALEIALQMVTLSMTKEIKQDTTHLLSDSAAIKNDTSEILQEIARLRAQLPDEQATLRPSTEDSDITLARYLDDLESYAETVCWSGEDSDTDVEHDYGKSSSSKSKLANLTEKGAPSLDPTTKNMSHVVTPPSKPDTATTYVVATAPDHGDKAAASDTNHELVPQPDDAVKFMFSEGVDLPRPSSLDNRENLASMILETRPMTTSPKVNTLGKEQRITISPLSSINPRGPPKIPQMPNEDVVESRSRSVPLPAPPPLPVFIESSDTPISGGKQYETTSPKPYLTDAKVQKLVSLGSTSELTFNARPVLFIVKAVLDYDPRYRNQLTFKRGQIIHVVEETGVRWYTGYIDGSTFCGLFPRWYVEKQEPTPIDQQEPGPQQSSSLFVHDGSIHALMSTADVSLPRLEHSITDSVVLEGSSVTGSNRRSASADCNEPSKTRSNEPHELDRTPRNSPDSDLRPRGEQSPLLSLLSLNSPSKVETLCRSNLLKEISYLPIKDCRTDEHEHRNTVSTEPTAWKFHDYLATTTKVNPHLRCHHKSGELLVVKSYPRMADRCGESNVKVVRMAEILALLDHRHIIRLQYFACTTDSWLLFLEDGRASTLSQYISQYGRTSIYATSTTTWDENVWQSQVRNFARQIGSALRYLQLNCIQHNSLHADKILLSRNGDVKLAGFSSVQMITSLPEESFDVFCYGAILWHMLYGSVPWPAVDNRDRFIRIDHTSFRTKPAYLSSALFGLVMGLLFKQARLSLQQALDHPWMFEGYGTCVEAFMPERKPLATQVDLDICRKLELFDFDTPAHVQQALTAILDSSTYNDLVSMWTYCNFQAGTITPGVREQFKIVWKHRAAEKRLSSHWTELPPDPLHFWALLRSRIISPTLAMYYLAKEKMEREKAGTDAQN